MKQAENSFYQLALSDDESERIERTVKRRACLMLAAGGFVSIAGITTALAGLLKAEAHAIGGIVETSMLDYDRAGKILAEDTDAEVMVYAGTAAVVGGIVLMGASVEVAAHSADRQARRMMHDVQPTDITFSESRN